MRVARGDPIRALALKILSVATTHPRYQRDSEPAFVFYLNRELVRLGHEVTTLVPHAAGSLRREVVDGVHIHRFPYFWPESLQKLCYDGGTLPNLSKSLTAKVNLPFFLLAQFLSLTKEIGTGSYDLIHSHWLLPQGFFCGLLGRLRETPVVITAHGGDIYTDSALFRTVSRMALKRCRICTAVSGAIQQKIRGLNPVTPTEVISMGVDISAFSPDHRSKEIRSKVAGDPLLLFVGRLAAKKGACYLVQAMPEILVRFPNSKLAIIGTGPEGDTIRREVSRLALDDRVIMLGSMRQDEIPGYMASADLFVMPSIVTDTGDTEGLPVVLMEALASGLPVVSTNVGGVSELIRHGETGLSVRERDSHDLANKCIAMLESEDLRQTTVQQGRRLVQERFSWPTVAKRFEKVFQRAMDPGTIPAEPVLDSGPRKTEQIPAPRSRAR